MTTAVDLPSPVASPPARPPRRLQAGRLYWLWPALTAAVVTGYQLQRPQLWRDELATLSAAGRSPGALSRLSENIDAVLVPYYWVLHFWTAVAGDSARALRLPSVLAVAATAALLAVLGARLFTVRAGVLAGLLFAVIPSVTRYGQEARPYALAGLASTAATLMLVEALRHGGRWRWMSYALAVLSLGGLHLVALTLLTGHAAVVVRHAVHTRSWRPFPPAALAVTVACAALIPLALNGRAQLTTQLGAKPHPPTPEGVLHILEQISLSTSVGGLLLGLCLLGLADRRARVGALTIVLPIAAMVTVSTMSPIWHPRYLFFVLPLICLLAGVALARTPWPAGLALVLVVGMLGLPDQRFFRGSHEKRTAELVDYRAAARVVARERQPGDAIVYKRDGWQFADIAVEYYLGADTPRDALAAQSRDEAGGYWTPERADVATALAGDTRVWALIPDNVTTGASSALSPPVLTALQRDFTVSRTWRVSGFDIQLFVRR
ncbi:glycosyltransferase family 39 protein [Actinoplanes sp. CA-252034]|uniref:glycosyltransferase family 39 protein n=1 Tax=Actinoplanes sp. CA-252034 TaxID=3239906 RepID=UPI003D95AACB